MSDDILQDLVDSLGLETVVKNLVTIAEDKERWFNGMNTDAHDKEARQWHRAVVALDKALMNIDI